MRRAADLQHCIWGGGQLLQQKLKLSLLMWWSLFLTNVGRVGQFSVEAMCDLGLSMSLSEVHDYTVRSSKCIEQDNQIHTSMDESDLRRKYIDHSRFPCDDPFLLDNIWSWRCVILSSAWVWAKFLIIRLEARSALNKIVKFTQAWMSWTSDVNTPRNSSQLMCFCRDR